MQRKEGGPAVSDAAGPKKSSAASYWDNKTTELVIPEMGEEN